MTLTIASSVRLALALAVLVTGGCSHCEPTELSEAVSSDGQYRAASYRRECGVMAPLNVVVGLKGQGDSDWHEVLSMRDSPYIANVEWTGPRAITVTVECPIVDEVGCLPAGSFTWTLAMDEQWGDVAISYRPGPTLARRGGSDILQRLVR